MLSGHVFRRALRNHLHVLVKLVDGLPAEAFKWTFFVSDNVDMRFLSTFQACGPSPLMRPVSVEDLFRPRYNHHTLFDASVQCRSSWRQDQR